MDRIRIGTFSSISNTWLPSILSSYKKLHPETVFEIKIGFLQIAEWLSKGEIDLALGDQERCKTDNWKPLFEEPYYAVMPSDFAADHSTVITQTDLAEYPLIIPPASVLLDRLQTISSKQINVTGDDDSTLVAMVAQGLGTAIMPHSCLLNVPKQVKILKLSPGIERTIGIAMAESLCKPFVRV
ncbi:MAG: LysR family transcriptional regulator substrate-binding protein [Lachnospiraceae bacterium]